MGWINQLLKHTHRLIYKTQVHFSDKPLPLENFTPFFQFDYTLRAGSSFFQKNFPHLLSMKTCLFWQNSKRKSHVIQAIRLEVLLQCETIHYRKEIGRKWHEQWLFENKCHNFHPSFEKTRQFWLPPLTFVGILAGKYVKLQIR